MLSFFSVLDIKLKITITFELNFCFEWVKWETAHDLILLIYFAYFTYNDHVYCPLRTNSVIQI